MLFDYHARVDHGENPVVARFRFAAPQVRSFSTSDTILLVAMRTSSRDFLVSLVLSDRSALTNRVF